MEIKKSNRGGYRPGSGRKAKADEIKLAQKLGPYEDTVIDIVMDKILKDGDKDMIKLYFNYLHGTPRQKVESEVNQTIQTVSLKDLVRFNDDVVNDDFNDDEFDIDNF